jgi:hypothetical protein
MRGPEAMGRPNAVAIGAPPRSLRVQRHLLRCTRGQGLLQTGSGLRIAMGVPCDSPSDIVVTTIRDIAHRV